MPSSYTSLLRFELPVQGELSGTWGNVVNTAITTPVSEAIAGTTSITVGATNYTLTNGDGASANEARKMFITAIGSPGGTREVICPSTSKLYVFFNNTSDGSALTFKAGGSGVTVSSGQRRLLYCDGTNVVDAVNGFGSLTLGTALGATSGGTGQASYAVGDLLYASTTTALSKLAVGATNAVLTVAAGIPAWVTTLPVASGGTGAATLTGLTVGNGTGAFTSLGNAIGDVYKIPKLTPIDAFTAQWTLQRFGATTAEVQAGTSTDYALTPSSFRGGALVVGTAQNTTSGVLVDFTGIPSWVKRVTVFFNNVSTSGSSNLLIQLGAGSITTTGYNSIGATISNVGAGATTSTTGFAFSNGNIVAGSGCYGSATFCVQASNIWAGQGMLADTGRGFIQCTSGTVALSGTLDRLRITTTNGTDTFDSGSVNIVYE